MPLESEAERRWAYYVPQPIPDDAVKHASESVRDLKILDPAVGSGHFLVVAFDLLLAALYREEARQRGEAGEDQVVRPGDRGADPRAQPARHRSGSACGADRRCGACGSRPSRPARRPTPGSSTWWPRTCGCPACLRMTRPASELARRGGARDGDPGRAHPAVARCSGSRAPTTWAACSRSMRPWMRRWRTVRGASHSTRVGAPAGRLIQRRLEADVGGSRSTSRRPRQTLLRPAGALPPRQHSHGEDLGLKLQG